MDQVLPEVRQEMEWEQGEEAWCIQHLPTSQDYIRDSNLVNWGHSKRGEHGGEDGGGALKSKVWTSGEF